MFNKLLIANRGEIACRVIATARRMGISTVAVYSDADRDARHVAMADEAVRIGPPPAAESYLRVEALLDAAARTGAEAVHPGYGFLSENPAFVEAVEAAGLTFIGPPASAIRAMGLKDAAKALMAEAGVPIVPGYHGDRQDPAFLEGEADAIGFPVLIKARAGGGGKGMRRVDAAAAFADALESCRREAEASFGDPTCLIEKYVEQPRHVEIQVFADAHGTILHLFERDCSLQRRHQKVIEEAPAPRMPPEVRAAMGAAAIEAARAIGYRGAGTVEFIADGSGPLRRDGFWFMEMNTRLQVEHPVTEAITGLDLVALQVRVAAGEPLPIAQEDLSIDGHAVEARLYAEDPAKGFLPATGRLVAFQTPNAAAFAPGPVRIDAGVRAGDAITPYYDPMIAKVIAHGRDRAEALARLAAALDGVLIAGCVTNRDFLRALARHDGFRSGAVDTGLIARDLESLAAPAEADETATALAALASLDLLGAGRPRHSAIDPDPWARLTGFRLWEPACQTALLTSAGDPLERQVAIEGAGRFTVSGGARPVSITLAEPPEARSLERNPLDADPLDADPLDAVQDGAVRAARFEVDGRMRSARLVVGREIIVEVAGAAWIFGRPDPLAARSDGDAAQDLIAAPMPGLVRAVRVAVGDRVARGAPLAVLEAMKMEHVLTAPRDGLVAEVMVAEGAQVADGAELIRLAPETPS